jgi:glycosidase
MPDMKRLTPIKCLIYTYLVLIVHGSPAFAQVKCYPPHWWKGMQNDTLELLIDAGKELRKIPEVKTGVEVLTSELAPNPRYAYLTIIAGKDAPDQIEIKVGGKSLDYDLKDRRGVNPGGLTPADVMYLITPDRFANADPSNDRVKAMNEKVYSRDSIYGRHGGDIQGIIDHLDYISDLGCNSLWICPLLENNEFKASYHGYAITDHYLIDPRFGTNKLYGELVEEMHGRDMKMVMDVVYNHFGSQHHLFLDPPDSAFFNWHQGFVRTNYRAATLYDPHVSQHDKHQFTDGWFDGHMPDVNQRNSHMASFLIQNSIWWIEEYGIDAFRIDTYTYPDQQFMADLSKRVRQEYPNFFLFGETWVHFPEIQSYFVEDNRYNPIATHLNNVTDFQFAFALTEALQKEQGWTEGVAKLYYRLASDYLYEDPSTQVIFLDNHDLARIYGTLGQDMKKMRMAMGVLFTMRGIPCLYYGTEIGMKETENHGVIREDFPGGWPDDAVNKFTSQERSEEENQIFNWISDLLTWRQTSTAVTQGKFMHFVPQEGVYTYFRYTDEEVVMVMVNSNNDKDVETDLERFKEIWDSEAPARDVITGDEFKGDHRSLPAQTISILQQKRP